MPNEVKICSLFSRVEPAATLFSSCLPQPDHGFNTQQCGFEKMKLSWLPRVNGAEMGTREKALRK